MNRNHGAASSSFVVNRGLGGSNPGSAESRDASSRGDTSIKSLRISTGSSSKYGLMKFSSSLKMDFSKTDKLTMQRENNYKEFRNAHNLDTMPTSGAGSEFGREAREEVRRRKFGFTRHEYIPDDQPWLLRLRSGKQLRKFKGTREGGIANNACYFIIQPASDGHFEARPVYEWYTFVPQVCYKYLNEEEAEEEFQKRDKHFNLMNLMVQKRLKVTDDSAIEENASKGKKSKSRNRDLMLTELEEWDELNKVDEEEEDEGSDVSMQGEGEKVKDKKGKKHRAAAKQGRTNSDDEAVEESDDGDEEGQEFDYVTDSSVESAVEVEEDKSNYAEKGVEDEDALKRLTESGDESSEKEDEFKEPGLDSSGEDNDKDDATATEKSTVVPSKSKKKPKVIADDLDDVSSDSDAGSSSTSEGESRPQSANVKKKSEPQKRKKSFSEDLPASKRPMMESRVGPSVSDLITNNTAPPSSDVLSEQAVRRYLLWKPMTIRELLKKFRSKSSLPDEQLAHQLVQILEKLSPERKEVNKKFYLFLNP